MGLITQYPPMVPVQNKPRRTGWRSPSRWIVAAGLVVVGLSVIGLVAWIASELPVVERGNIPTPSVQQWTPNAVAWCRDVATLTGAPDNAMTDVLGATILADEAPTQVARAAALRYFHDLNYMNPAASHDIPAVGAAYGCPPTG